MKITLRLFIVALLFSISPLVGLAQPGGGPPDSNFHRGDTTFLHRLDSIINARRGQDTGNRPPDTGFHPLPPDTTGGGPNGGPGRGPGLDSTFLHRLDSIINARRGKDTGVHPFPPDTGINPFPPDTGGGPGHGPTGGGPGLDSTFLHRLDSIINAHRGGDTGIHPFPPDTGVRPPDTTGGGPGHGPTGGGPGLDSLFRHRLDSIINAHRGGDTGTHPFPPDTGIQPPDTTGGGPGHGGGGPGLDSLFRHRLDSIINARRGGDTGIRPPDTGNRGPGKLGNGGIRNFLDSLIGHLLGNGRLDSLLGHLHGGGPSGGGPDTTINTGGGGTPDTTINLGGGGGPDTTINKGGGTPDTTINTGGGGTPDTTINTGGGGKPDTTINTGGGGTPDTTINTGGGGKPDTTINTGGGGTPDTTINTGGGGAPDTTIKTGGGGGLPTPNPLPGGQILLGNPVGGGSGLGPIDSLKHGITEPLGGQNLSIEPIVPNPLISGSSVTVSLSLQTDANVTVGIYDQTGSLVQTVANASMAAGSHSLTITGSRLSEGMYIVRVQAGAEVQSTNLIVE